MNRTEEQQRPLYRRMKCSWHDAIFMFVLPHVQAVP